MRSSAVMAAGTATSRGLGFLRAVVLATAIGVTVPSANAFDVANKIPNILYLLIAGGILNAVLVPQIVRASRAPDGGQEFVNRLLTLALSVLVGLTVVLTLAVPLLVNLYARPFQGPTAALAVGFAYWCLPQVLFYGLYTVLGQVLNARGSFGPYMWAPVVNNVIGIAGLLAFIAVYGSGTDGQHDPQSWTPEKIALIAGTATLGVVVQALVLVVPLRRLGFTFSPRWGLRGAGLGSARTVAMWTFAAVLVGQLGFITTSNVAARASSLADQAGDLSIAGNSAYTNAYLLFMLPHSLVAVSVVTALFTRLSHAATENDVSRVRADLSTGLRIVGVVSVLATVGLVVLADAAGTVIAGDAEPGRAVGRVAAAMVLGLVPFSATYLLQRVFYAYEDARTPFLVQVPVVAVMVVGNVLSATLLDARWMVVGVGLSMSLGHFVGCAVAATLLRRRIGRLDGHRVVRTHVRLLLAGIVAGLVGWGVTSLMAGLTVSGRGEAALVVLVGGSVISLVYLAGLKVLRVDELDRLVSRLPARLRRG